jgi:hypothetical protein
MLSCDDSSNHLQYVVARSQKSVFSITRIMDWSQKSLVTLSNELNLFKSIKTNSGTHSASYSMGKGGSLPGSKMKKGCSPLESSAKAKNEWSYTSMTPRAIMLRTEITLPDQAK